MKPAGTPSHCSRLWKGHLQVERRRHGFTLIELLVVLSIMAILAALTVPALRNFAQAEAQVSGTRHLMDEVARARQLALSQRTTVYLVFLPASFWSDASAPGNAAAWQGLPQSEKDKAARLYDKQLTGYTFVTVRSVGDQPGTRNPRYLTPWRTLPEGVFIPPWKFQYNGPKVRIYDPAPPLTPQRIYEVAPFRWTTPDLGVPFPSPTGSTAFRLPYLAFNHLGQLVSEVEQGSLRDAYLPLARGNVTAAYGPDGTPLAQPPSVSERPPGNSTNAFNLVYIEWLTGRARVIRQEVQ